MPVEDDMRLPSTTVCRRVNINEEPSYFSPERFISLFSGFQSFPLSLQPQYCSGLTGFIQNPFQVFRQVVDDSRRNVLSVKVCESVDGAIRVCQTDEFCYYGHVVGGGGVHGVVYNFENPLEISSFY